ncbi:MAG: hypothetical protein J1F65_05895 [Clostridiales bacterium]|nr:hypothetical protein [Clostridiales bacterium]
MPKLTPAQKAEIANLKMGYACLEKEVQSEFDRFKTADEKANMFLVFNAAILALFIIIFPLPEFSMCRKNIFWILFTVLCMSLATTVILIIISIFPRTYSRIDASNLLEAEFYQCSSEEFIGNIMVGHSDMLEELYYIVDKKFKLLTGAMILTILNISLIVILLILTNA